MKRTLVGEVRSRVHEEDIAPERLRIATGEQRGIVVGRLQVREKLVEVGEHLYVASLHGSLPVRSLRLEVEALSSQLADESGEAVMEAFSEELCASFWPYYIQADGSSQQVEALEVAARDRVVVEEVNVPLVLPITVALSKRRLAVQNLTETQIGKVDEW